MGLEYLVRKKYYTGVIFTPSSSANVNYVKRKTIEDEFIKNLHIPGKQLIVYGQSGGGKTTMVNNILKKHNQKSVLVGCMEGDTFDSLIMNIFDQLNPFYIETKSLTKGRNLKGSLAQDYFSIKSQIHGSLTSEATLTHKRVLPIQLSPARLIDFLGIAECVLILEDFHKLFEEEKTKLSQLLKLFMDASSKYSKLKIIAIGAVGSAREVVKYDKELANRVFELHVPLLEDDELRTIIHRGARLLNVKIKREVTSSIIRYSNQLGAVCHQLCYNLCYFREVYKTTSKNILIDKEDLDVCVQSFLNERSDTYRELLDNILRYESNGILVMEMVLIAISKLNKENFKEREIYEEITIKRPNFPKRELDIALTLLSTNTLNFVLRYDDNSDKYSFNDPFFKAFVVMHYRDRIEVGEFDEYDTLIHQILRTEFYNESLLDQLD